MESISRVKLVDKKSTRYLMQMVEKNDIIDQLEKANGIY